MFLNVTAVHQSRGTLSHTLSFPRPFVRIFSYPDITKSASQRQLYYKQPPVALAMASLSSASSGPVGFIGLGIMGQGMAARLLSEGVAGTGPDRPLVVWNRSGAKCADLVARFPDRTVLVKATPREVVEACGVTYSMLSTPEVAREVFQGDTGVLVGVGPGRAIVDCATLAEADMQAMEQAVVARGGYVTEKHPVATYVTEATQIKSYRISHDTLLHRRFLEAPVSGSKGPAAQGTLIFLCAGDEGLFNEIKDTGLKVMGKASHFFGTSVGAGTRAKLVVNSLMGTMLAAFSEGLALAETVGLDTHKMIEVIGQGAVACPMYSLKGPKMLASDHAPNFPLKHAHKDMALACDMAKAAGVEFSVMDSAEKLYREARENEEGAMADEDFSAVYKQIKKRG